ncbi:MAG: hypothetical protein KIT18_01645, partial [Burkholderiales bacterium]|nr:hypothetical protein [Burkholderiales bacterium]
MIHPRMPHDSVRGLAYQARATEFDQETPSGFRGSLVLESAGVVEAASAVSCGGTVLPGDEGPDFG